jgi:glycosyltransferase involved in cell wall biosynthesis
MWVLHICHSYYPPFLDCARQYNALFKGTPYKVLTVYLTGEHNADVERDTQSDEVFFLGFKSKQVRGLKLGAIAKIKAIAKQKEFLFCIAHRVKPTYVALLATKLPVISVHHNYNDYSRWSRRLFVNCFQHRLLMLGVSNAVRDDLRQDLKTWDEERIHTLYNHIDVAATQTIMAPKYEARQSLNLPQDAYVIGNVGRLHHDKDQVTLIRGFHQALPDLPPNSLLYIAGKGPLEQELKQLINDLQLSAKVILAGNIPDAKRFFKAFDVFVLTSDREPFGMVLLEAMAAELPIICSDCGGGAEVAKDVGQLFEFRNVENLKGVILGLNRGNQANSSIGKLNAAYSDEAAKNAFWHLSFVKTILGAGND